MTQLLEQALAEVRKLPEQDQDAIAALVPEELADDRCWDDAFARPLDALSKLAAKPRGDIKAGRMQDAEAQR